MNLVFLPAAQEELAAAVAYLEIRASGLGRDLLDDVERISALYRRCPVSADHWTIFIGD